MNRPYGGQGRRPPSSLREGGIWAPLQGELSRRPAAVTEGFAPSVNDSLRHGACVRRSVTPPSKREAYVLPCKGSCHGGSPPRLRNCAPLQGELSRRLAAGTEGSDPSVTVAGSGDTFTLRCPKNAAGLRLSLAFFDRCGKSTIALSATGSAMALFPLSGEDMREAEKRGLTARGWAGCLARRLWCRR